MRHLSVVAEPTTGLAPVRRSRATVFRARRAWLPPSALWLFRPRNYQHDIGALALGLAGWLAGGPASLCSICPLSCVFWKAPSSADPGATVGTLHGTHPHPCPFAPTPPSCAGGWYVEWAGHEASEHPAWLDPAVCVLSAGFDTLDYERARRQPQGLFGRVRSGDETAGGPLAWVRAMLRFHRGGARQ